MNTAAEYLAEKIKFLSSAVYALFLPLIHKKPRRLIIYYHNIQKKDLDKFEKQMAYLTANRRVVKPSQIKTVSSLDSEIIVGITFDDAFTGILENALPILKKYGLNAAIFVPTANLGRRPDWSLKDDSVNTTETIINQQQLKAIDNKSFELFSHTASHPVLTRIDDEALKTELVESRQMLEKITNRQVSAISYPYGACNKVVSAAAAEAGYKLGFTITPAIVQNSADSLELGRFAVSPNDSLLKFALKTNGAYEAVRYLQMLKHLFVRKSI